MKDKVLKIIKKVLEKKGIQISSEEIGKIIEIPPSAEMGDFAFPCFFLASKLKKNPNEIALELSSELKSKDFEKIDSKGPYVNFFIDKKTFSESLIKEILSKKGRYGAGKIKKTTMVEFPSPNTNKPLHLGHLRNMAIGESISRILEFRGEKAIRTSLNNDRGVHICKSVFAYKLFGKGKTPKSEKMKSDHFVGSFYVLFNTKKIPDIEAQKLLQKWEEGDKETIALWKKMNKWVLNGFKETYKEYGIKLNKEFFESDIYSHGKKIVEYGLKKGIFKKKEDGSIFIDLNKEGLGEKIVLRSDGTSLYITQDLYLAKLKFDKFKIDRSIYIVGNEQDYHFKVLISILEKFGFNFSDKIKHLSYGMVNLPEGKMKSREGAVVDADDLIGEIKKMVKDELKSRTSDALSSKELESRSLKIALASIKYLLLKTDTRKNMVFNPKESIKFEGDTGPYLQYSYARASSILRKIKNQKSKKPKTFKTIDEKEFALIRELSKFEEIAFDAYVSLNPSLVAHYAYHLAQTFNEFYHACPVIGSEKEAFRANLVRAFKQVMKNSLNLLGIESLEEM